MIPLMMLPLAAMSPSAPPVASGRPNVAALFSYDDYPDKALENGWEGGVIVKLRIGTNGRVRACRIVKSSGHQVLDIKTCEIMLLRARFTPARDRNGNAVEDDFQTPMVHWFIAEDPTPKPEPASQ